MALAAIKHALRPSGFAVAAGELPTRLVLQEQRVQHIDFHTVTFDPEERCLHAPEESQTDGF
jgi:hypothetical protein